MRFASRRFSSRLGCARGGLGGQSGLRPGRFDAECLLGYGVGHRRAHERCVSLRAASLRAWGGRGVARQGVSFGILPTRYEAESARIRKRSILESVAFQFPAQVNAPGPKTKNTYCLGDESKTALHKPLLTVASVLLSCAWSLFAFVCCGAARVRAVSARAAPTSIPRATRF